MSNLEFYLRALKPKKGDHLVIPSASYSETILNHFKLTKDEFEQGFYQAAGPLSKLWSFKHNPDLTIDYARKLVFHDGKQYKIQPGINDITEQGVKFTRIRGWISTDEINSIIMNSKMRGDHKRPVPHKDLFNLIINDDLKGKDLISACLTDVKINARCDENDQQLFKDRLESEFALDFDEETYDYPDPRTLYIQMHTLFLKVVRDADEDEEDAETFIRAYINGDSPYQGMDLEVEFLVPRFKAISPQDWEPTKEIFTYDGRRSDGVLFAFEVEWKDAAKTIPSRITKIIPTAIDMTHYESMLDAFRNHFVEIFANTLGSVLRDPVAASSYARRNPAWSIGVKGVIFSRYIAK